MHFLGKTVQSHENTFAILDLSFVSLYRTWYTRGVIGSIELMAMRDPTKDFSLEQTLQIE